MIESLLFLIFGGLTVAATLFMIVTKNVIHGAYALAAVLLSIAGLFVLLNADFLAVIQIFMYAGGVVILLIFGIMLTNREANGTPITAHVNVFLGGLISLTLLAVLSYVILNAHPVWLEAEVPIDQVSKLGMLLLTDHLIAFELIAILLLAVLVGAALVAKKSNRDA